MGFLRGFAKWVVGIIFLILLIALLANIVIYKATTAEVLSPIFSNIISSGFSSQDISAIYNDSIKSCQTQSFYSPPIENISLNISCSKINSSTQADFPKIIAEGIFNNIYGRKCSQLDCLKLTDIPGFITQSFNSLLKQILIVTAALTIIFALFLFLLGSELKSKFRGLAVPLILAGITAPILEFSKSKIQLGSLQPLVDKITGITIQYLLFCLVLGVVFLVISLVIKGPKKAKKTKKSKKK
jgi:hypothetical protein